ncbi:MAG: iron-sulfur cluster-binding domain-containing protein [Bacilli bacterium]|jgi:ferredoxin-NADP reductase|nr:iron-sulfur cluster-binding domain-containing protein [Bacilli bacterium]
MPNIRSLNKMDFTKMIPDREAKIADASTADALPNNAYIANRLAEALHPYVQYLKIKDVIDRGGDAKTFVFGPDGKKTKELAYFNAGSYLSVVLSIDGVHLTRPYSLSSSPRDSLSGTYCLTVKRAFGGLASNFMLDKWKKGDVVEASAPLGQFTYSPIRDQKVVVGLAGGSGITPFYSLAQAIADGDEDCSLILLYGSKTLSEALFEKEFKALEKRCPKFKLVNVLSNESLAGCEHGFLGADLIKKYAPKGEYSLFICGPQAMYDFLEKETPKLGLRRKDIRHELFGEIHDPSKDPSYPSEKKNGHYQLKVHIDDETKTIPCSADESLLVSMEKAGISVPTHCRSGECGFCHSRLISGNVYVPEKVDGRRMADKLYGYIHPCVSFPLSDVEVEVPHFKP